MKNGKTWYHLVGICGSSMNGIASYLARMEYHVTGSDIRSCKISNLKSQIYVGHSKDHIVKDIDCVIYTSAVTPGSSGYIEIEEAKKLGIKILRRSELIGELMRDMISIGVTGMHGKSTTSSMIASILNEAKLYPSYLIGAKVKNTGDSFQVGKAVKPPIDEETGKTIYAPKRAMKDGKVQYFVAEACEYDRSFLDMKPKIGVITNIDREHLDYYKGGISEIKQAFKKFIRKLPEDGLLVVWQEDRYVMPLTKAAKCKVKRVSSNKPWPGLKLLIPGQQYLVDATLAAKTAHELGVDSKTIIKALNNFKGAERRFEVKGQKNGVIVLDDYGHHPTEIKATIMSAKEFISEDFKKRCALFSRTDKLPESACDPLFSKSLQNTSKENKLIMVFQPHQQARTKLLFKDFVGSFKGVNKLIIDDVYLIAGREKDTEENLAKKMAEEIKKTGVDAEYISGYDMIEKHLKQIAKSGDVIITQGATDIYKVGETYLHS